jgi:uncharacterized membrane protein YhaH (DUF805 family)
VSGIHIANIGDLAALGAVPLLLGLVLFIVNLIATIMVIRKAGYSGWWVLILLVPVVGYIFALIFAFSKWPVQKELEAAKAARPEA